jgi:hypothetical protein
MNKGFAIVCLVVLTCLIVTGCAPRDVAMMNMNSSKSKYKECLEAFPNDSEKCETQRKLFEIDRDAVEATSRSHIKVK